jgi:hypothetical protein
VPFLAGIGNLPADAVRPLSLSLPPSRQYKPDADPASAQYKPDADPASAQYKPDADRCGRWRGRASPTVPPQDHAPQRARRLRRCPCCTRSPPTRSRCPRGRSTSRPSSSGSSPWVPPSPPPSRTKWTRLVPPSRTNRTPLVPPWGREARKVAMGAPARPPWRRRVSRTLRKEVWDYFWAKDKYFWAYINSSTTLSFIPRRVASLRDQTPRNKL